MSDDVLAGVDVVGSDGGTESQGGSSDTGPSIDETLAATLADIRARDTEGTNEPADTSSSSGPARSADGRFTAQTTDAASPVDGAAVETPAQDGEAQVVERPVPETWRAEAKAKWAELPDWAKDEVLKRETDVLNGFKARDEHSQFGRSMQQIISPYLPLIQSQGGNPEAAVKSLLNTAYILHQGSQAQKTAAVRDMIRQFGIDLGSGEQSGAEEIDPRIKPVLDRVQQLEAGIQQQREHEYQSLVQSAQSELAEWKAKENPKYFEQVHQDMVGLLQSGQVRSYGDAYNKACRLNDGVYAAMQAEQLAAAEKKRLEAVAKSAATVKKTVHMRTTPAPAVQRSSATIDDTLRDKLAEIRARA